MFTKSKIWGLTSAAFLLLFGLAVPVSADLAAVGPVSEVTGFPIFFSGTTNAGPPAVGRTLQLCDEGGTLPEEAPCLPELINLNGGFVDGNIGEALYYAAVAQFAGPNNEFILAQCVVEAAGPELVGDTNTVGNVALLRIEDITVGGDYTVVTPCGSFTFNHPADTDAAGGFRGEGGATGLPGDLPSAFSGAIPGAVQIFASNDTGAPGFLGDAVTTGVLDSPLRPDGPTTVTVSGAITASSDQFTVVGKLSGCTVDNLAPTAIADVAATNAATAVIIAVLGNDTDVVVNPVSGLPVTVDPIQIGTVAIVADSLTPGSGTAVLNVDNTITFTPAVDFTGTATFQYTVTDACGLVSLPASVTVLVEDLQGNTAEYRARTGRWTISGSSSEVTANTITLRIGDAAGPIIGTAEVQLDGTWSFIGKSVTSPGAAPQIVHIQSTAGVTATQSLRIR